MVLLLPEALIPPYTSSYTLVPMGPHANIATFI